MKNWTRAMLAILVSVVVCALLIFAVGENHASKHVFLFCALICFVIQWLIFIPSFMLQTEKYYDLTGSLTFISVTLFALFTVPLTPYTALLAGMVVVWAMRLGSFLFARIVKDGTDSRFDDIKPDLFRFFAAWTLQGLWVFVTSCAALAGILHADQASIGIVALVGGLIWLAGLSIETIADWQKRQFKKTQDNDFIHQGLWYYSRHPNYFGEILLWTGIAVAALPVLHAWQYSVLVSPVFVSVLLIKVSGIPLLEKKADDKWGEDPEYQNYKASTPVLIPNIFKTR